MAKYSVLGTRQSRVDALDKVTGTAIYAADINLPDMLYGKVLRSPYAHANICRLDVSKARALKGVEAVITVDDVPGQKAGREFYSNYPCMARHKVVFAGQPVAVVAAMNQDIARKALELIEVDYEILTPVTDVVEAMKPDAPIIHPHQQANLNLASKAEEGSAPSNVAWHKEFGRGDVDAGFKKADIVLENTFRTQRVHQGYLEPRAAVASVGLGGRITIWTDSQSIFRVREFCAAFLDLPVSKIRVMPVEIGGAFGAKTPQLLSPICALLSLKSGRPVKIVMTREEDLITNHPAPDSTITIKVGADKEGHLIAVSATVIFDKGAFTERPSSMAAAVNGLSPYVIPNLKVDCYDVFTNKTPTGSYRAPSATQGAFATESQMDLLARALGIDPLELRLRNVASEGDLMLTASRFPRVGFKETLEKMKQYLSTRGKPEGENRGRGIACGFWMGGVGCTSAHVNVNADGTVALVLGVVDLTGSRTSLAQIAAEEFGIPFEGVTVVSGDTDTAPHSDVTVGSRTTHEMGAAVCRACQDAKDQLIQHAALLLKMKPSELVFANGGVGVAGVPDKFISLADLAKSAISGPGGGPVTGRGSVGTPQQTPMFVAHTADVEVDRETGKVRIVSYVAAQDVGFAINPTLIEGQIQGAVSQGIGWAIMEGYALHEGIIQNPTLLDYRLPTSLDLPSVDTLIVEVKSTTGPYGVRGVGEPPIVPCLATIANAVHSATGVRMRDLPMTPEAVFWALQGKGNSAKEELKRDSMGAADCS